MLNLLMKHSSGFQANGKIFQQRSNMILDSKLIVMVVVSIVFFADPVGSATISEEAADCYSKRNISQLVRGVGQYTPLGI